MKITKFFNLQGKECPQADATEVVIQEVDRKGKLQSEKRYIKR